MLLSRRCCEESVNSLFLSNRFIWPFHFGVIWQKCKRLQHPVGSFLLAQARTVQKFGFPLKKWEEQGCVLPWNTSIHSSIHPSIYISIPPFLPPSTGWPDISSTFSKSRKNSFSHFILPLEKTTLPLALLDAFKVNWPHLHWGSVGGRLRGNKVLISNSHWIKIKWVTSGKPYISTRLDNYSISIRPFSLSHQW